MQIYSYLIISFFWQKKWKVIIYNFTLQIYRLFLYINNNLYICAMRLVEQHIIKQSSIYYNEIQDLLHKCKNLYNKGLYVVRKHYFQYKDDNTVKYKYLNYYSLEKKLRIEDDVDYRALPSPVAQQVLMMVDQNFKSFFNLLNKKNRGEYSEKVRIPKYLDKDGMFMAVFPTTAFSQKWIKQGIVKLPIRLHLRGSMLRSLRNPIPQNVVFWITSRFVSMRNMLEDVSNEDCSRHLPAILLTPISMVRLTSLENRQKKPSM